MIPRPCLDCGRLTRGDSRCPPCRAALPPPLHHRGDYQARARRVRQAANTDPATRCWRCGRTLAEVRRQKPDARWTAGHLTDTDPTSALAPECSPCNYSNGARLANKRTRQPR